MKNNEESNTTTDDPVSRAMAWLSAHDEDPNKAEECAIIVALLVELELRSPE